MGRYLWPVVLLVGLLALTPFASASTLEVWIEGIYDAESDGLVDAAKSVDSAIDCVPLERAGHLPVVANLSPIVADSTALAVIRPARPCRAPPALPTLGSR